MLSVILGALKSFPSRVMNFTLSIKFLMFARFLSGFYYNFDKNTIVNRLAVVYCVSINMFLLSYFSLHLAGPKGIAFYGALLDRCVLVSVSFYTKGEHFWDYVAETQRISSALGWKCLAIESSISKVLSCIVFGRVLLMYLMHILYQWSPVLLVVFHSADLSYVPVILMLELFRYRMKLLRQSAERLFCLHTLRGENGNTRLKLIKIKKVVHIYQHLYNNIEANFNMLKIMIFYKFTISFRQILVVSYIILNNIKEKGEKAEFLLAVCIEILISSMISFMGPVVIELAANELDKIKTILANQLQTNSEAEVREALQDALTYLRLRPFRCVVLRALPVDASTPLALLSLVTNYLIVMMQFMKSNVEA